MAEVEEEVRACQKTITEDLKCGGISEELIQEIDMFSASFTKYSYDFGLLLEKTHHGSYITHDPSLSDFHKQAPSAYYSSDPVSPNICCRTEGIDRVHFWAMKDFRIAKEQPMKWGCRNVCPLLEFVLIATTNS